MYYLFCFDVAVNQSKGQSFIIHQKAVCCSPSVSSAEIIGENLDLK
jgi:hypothetical protein